MCINCEFYQKQLDDCFDKYDIYDEYMEDDLYRRYREFKENQSKEVNYYE